MKLGKAFEILVGRILINVGFTEVASDGLYIFNGAPGKMIQGLGAAHNADVLLEPPVQTPFYSRTRLLIECKNYRRRVGLNTVRSAIGLREDINHFDIVDIDELYARRGQHRHESVHHCEKYSYQVAIAAINGYTLPAQNLAATYRMPLLEFHRMPFWADFLSLLGYENCDINSPRPDRVRDDDSHIKARIIDLAEEVGARMAVAITNSGQILFLYCMIGEQIQFEDDYSLHWSEPGLPWQLESGKQSYLFQLPDDIMKLWLNNATDELKIKKEAIHCKERFLSNMIVYYKEYGRPIIKMISIDENKLRLARERL